MKLTEDRFPILECIEHNILSNKIQEFIDRQEPNKNEQGEILSSLPFFVNKTLQINYISKSIHEKLIETSNFIKAKSLLSGSPTTTGLLLLPETIYPDFTNIPEYINADPLEYPINTLLYSWLKVDDHDRIFNQHTLSDLKKRINEGQTPPTGANWEGLIQDLENHEEWGNDNDRDLVILPIYNDGTTQATKQFELISNQEIFGTEYSQQEGRSWYGKIHDYVMSFILFYNFTEAEIKTLHNLDTEQLNSFRINDEKYLSTSKNEIEIIDNNYFTKTIRTDGVGVNRHFRVQRHGVGNNQIKIVYIEDYKKDEYTRNAKT